MGKKLAIKGHSTRGKEVIELLKMLGGENKFDCDGQAIMYSYYVSGNTILNDRLSIIEDDDFVIFNLEEFLEKYPFKVGDKVVYTKFGDNCNDYPVTIESIKWTGTTIEYTFNDCVTCLAKDLKMWNGEHDMKEDWTDEMIERLDEGKKPEFDYEKAMTELMGFDLENECMNHEFDAFNRAVSEYGYDSKEALIRKFFIMLRKIGTTQHVLENNGFELPEGYNFKDDNGNVINTTKIVLEKKKKEYPKTYEECCKVLGYDDRETYCVCHTYENEKLFEGLYRLKVCRDAYWKIAGEEMGLRKPWNPTDSDYITGRYCIFVCEGKIICNTPAQDCILTFPTKKMRDAFYENFKDFIEQCKELL